MKFIYISFSEIISTAERTDIAPHVKDGYIMMFIYMPVVFTSEFTPYIGQIINPILKVNSFLFLISITFTVASNTVKWRLWIILISLWLFFMCKENKYVNNVLLNFFFTQSYAVLHSDMLGPFLMGSCYLPTLQGLLAGSQSSAICVHWLIYFAWLSRNFQACTE